MKKLIVLLLALSLALSCTALAKHDPDFFDASLTFGEDADGNMTVTVQDSSILASQRPTLTIPCDYANAYVNFDGKSVTSSLENGAITFVVAAGGTYTIMEGVDPNPPVDPTPPVDPDPPVDPKPPVRPDPDDDSDKETSNKDTSDKSEYTDITVGSENADDKQVEISAKVEIESGNAQVTLDTEKLAESLAQQVVTPPAAPSETPSDTPIETPEQQPAVQPVTVTIDLSNTKETVTAVTVDSTSVAAIAEAAASEDNAITGLTVKVETGEITLDAEVLSQVASAAEPLVVEMSTPETESLTKAQQKIMKDMPVVEINVTTGNTRLTDLGEGRIRASLPYTPAENEKVEQLVVWRVLDDGSLVPIKCSYLNGKIFFELDHLSHYVVVSFPFTDFGIDDWFYQDVAYAWSTGLMNGTGTDTFSPGATTSRGQIVTILWRLEGEPEAGTSTFTDVPAGSYYEQAIAWAAENGIVNGYSETSFAPDASITREQFATILYRYAKDYKGYDVSVGEDTNILSYSDAFTVSEYAYPALQWACGAGLINGSDNALQPTGNANRAQAAAILHRFCENIQ